jgi:hypothetical protein
MSEVKRAVTLSPAGATQAEQVRNIWAITTEYGTTREDIEKPEYWSHVAARLRPRDRIEVMSGGGDFYAEYMVLSRDRTWAKVVATTYIDLTKAGAVSAEQAISIMDGYEIKHRGPKRWSVLRKDDRAVLQEGMQSEEDCKKWLEVHLKTQGIAA